MLQPRHPETSGDPDMSQSLTAHQAKLKGQVSQPRPFVRPTHSITTPSSLSTNSTSPARTQVSQSRKTEASHRCKAKVFKQIVCLKESVVYVLLLILIMMLSHADGKPWYEQSSKHVTFNTPLCRPLSVEDLKRIMGPAWDESRMATDMATAKRTFGSQTGSKSGVNGYQGDDPGVAGFTDKNDLVEDEKVWASDVWMTEREEDVYTEGGLLDQVDVEEEEDEEEIVVERRTWLPRRGTRRRNLSRGRSSFSLSSFNEDSEEDDDDEKKTVHAYRNAFMRRRRRSIKSPSRPKPRRNRHRDEKHLNDDVLDGLSDEDVFDDLSTGSSTNSEDNTSQDSILPLRLVLSGKNKKLRRQLKKKFRQKAKRLRKKPPPWECKMNKKTLFMKTGLFPRVLIDGECAAKKCFYRLYDCEPSKYTITLLKRDPDHCNPIPNIGNSTVYEERWNLVKYPVTVGCNCASLSGARKYKNRRRN